MQKSPFGTIRQLCLAVSSQLRHLSTTGKKNLLNTDTSSTCPHMVNFGLLTSEICWRVWSTPANFNSFRVLAVLLHGTVVVGVHQTAALNRGRHLCLAGRPSRWASAHILLSSFFPRLISVVADWMSAIHVVWPSVNLECRSEMCCVRLAGNAGPKNRQKFTIWALSQTLSGYIFTTKAHIDNWKKLSKQQCLPHMSLQYGELRRTSV